MSTENNLLKQEIKSFFKKKQIRMMRTETENVELLQEIELLKARHDFSPL